MSPIRRTHRLTLAGALTCALLASIATGQAAARPAHDPPPPVAVHASAAGAQDMRSADARDAALRPSRAERPVNAGAQDLRSADARDAALRPSRAERSVIAPGATAADSATRIGPAPVVQAPDGGNGVDWTTIGFGIAGALLVLMGAVALVRHSRRIGRARVAA